MSRKPEQVAAQKTVEPVTTMQDAARDIEPAPLPAQSQGLANASSATQVALTSQVAAGFVLNQGRQVKIKRRVTIPTMALRVDPEATDPPGSVPDKLTIFGRIVQPIERGKALQGARYPTPAHLMTLESDSGNQIKIVVNAVLRKELEEAYPAPEDGELPAYVGGWFQITKMRKKAGKTYNTFEIIECEAP